MRSSTPRSILMTFMNTDTSCCQKIFTEKSIGESLPVFKIKKNLLANGISVLDFVAMTPLASSKGEIRRMIKNNGLKINNQIIDSEKKIINLENFNNNILKLSHGKKIHLIIKTI